MYNALTSTYNLFFRTKSPLDIDWKEEENFARIGRNTELRDLLSLIKEQIQAMCKFMLSLRKSMLIVHSLF
jgi:hypothetical protein